MEPCAPANETVIKQYGPANTPYVPPTFCCFSEASHAAPARTFVGLHWILAENIEAPYPRCCVLTHCDQSTNDHCWPLKKSVARGHAILFFYGPGNVLRRWVSVCIGFIPVCMISNHSMLKYPRSSMLPPFQTFFWRIQSFTRLFLPLTGFHRGHLPSFRCPVPRFVSRAPHSFCCCSYHWSPAKNVSQIHIRCRVGRHFMRLRSVDKSIRFFLYAYRGVWHIV